MECFRYNQLVYIPVPKNASTTFRTLFRDKLGWESSLTETINWSSDIVFSHINNPYERHIKGTAEFLIKYKLVELLDRDEFKLILSSAFFDQHTYPLTFLFKERADQIIWLPMDSPERLCNFITSKFLQSHGIAIEEHDIPHMYKSNTVKDALVERLRNLQNEHDNFQRLFFLLDDDMRLYNRAILSFNHGIYI